jgi:hypothetical protein
METQMTDDKQDAIVKRTDAAVAIPSAANLRMLAQDLLNSGMFPAVKNVAGAITIIEYGRELGIPPVAALQTMAIVNGRLCMEAKAMLAVFQNHGGRIKIVERSKAKCRIEFCKDGMEPYVHEYTMEQAKQEKLAGKDTWLKMPETMLFWRAVATGIRLFDPGSIFGLYSKDEIADLAPNRQETENARRGVAGTPSSSPSKQENGVPVAENGTSAGGEGFFSEPEHIPDAEVVEEPPAGDSFFGSEGADEGQGSGTGADRPLFSDDAINALVEAIKESVRVEGVDEKDWKNWLYHYQTEMKPPRHFVGMKFKNTSLHEGDVADLKWLHGNIQNSIRKYLAWKSKGAK